MPGFKSIFRLLLAAVLFFGYTEYLPRQAVRKGAATSRALDFDPASVTAIAISGFADGEVLLRRQPDRGWLFDGRPGLYADAAVLHKLLQDLAAMSGRPGGNFNAPTLTLRLERGGGAPLVIELGPRLAPFRKQLLRCAGRTLEVDRDLGAVLGVWRQAGPLDSSWIVGRGVLRLETDRVVRIRLEKPFASYEFELADPGPESDYAEGEPEAAADQKWRLLGREHAGLTPEPMGLAQYAHALAALEVRRLAGAELERGFKPLYRVAYRSLSGVEKIILLSPPVNEQQEHLLKLEKPAGGVYLISRLAFRKYAPHAAELCGGLPAIRLELRDAVEYVSVQDGRGFTFRRSSDGLWEAVQPRLPYRVRPRDEKSRDLRHENAVSDYLNSLAEIAAAENFTGSVPERQAMARRALAKPEAELQVRLDGGRTVRVSVSAPLFGGDLCFVQSGERILVTDVFMWEKLKPALADFFVPEELQGKELKW